MDSDKQEKALEIINALLYGNQVDRTVSQFLETYPYSSNSANLKQIGKILKHYEYKDLLMVSDPLAIFMVATIAGPFNNSSIPIQNAGTNALKAAVYCRELDVISQLLEWGVNPNIILEEDEYYTKESLLKRTLQLENPNMFFMLLDYGADPTFYKNDNIMLYIGSLYNQALHSRGINEEENDDEWILDVITVLLNSKKIRNGLSLDQLKYYESLVPGG